MRPEQGYVRLPGQRFAEDAVQWWYFRVEDDGWAFARGGRCRKTRDARRLIREAAHEYAWERSCFLDRPEKEMLEDGSLIDVRGRSPYEAVR